MNSIPPKTAVTAAGHITIEVRHADGRCERRKIGAADALLVGSANSCGLRLEGPGVAPLHCWLCVEDGRLWIQDWNSEQGVFVDEARVRGSACLAPEQVLRIGAAQIRVAGPDPLSPEASSSGLEEAVGQLVDSETVDCVEQHDDFDATWQTREEGTASEAAGIAAPPAGVDPFDQEMIEMLRAEVAHLESELADRDARLCELSAQNESTSSSDLEDGDDSLEGQTVLLLDRLESLLEELSESDRRVRTLEELLQSAEEVADAEREERRQIESWINDIEGRIAQREDEWRAELDVFRGQIEETAAERDRAEQMLARGHTADRAAQMQQELVHGLRRQVAQLGEALSVSEKAREELQQRLASIDVEKSERMCRESVAETLREERLQLAEERTELARMRADLARVKAEIAERERPLQKMPDEANTQIHALRRHLQEIHAQEKHEREQRRLSQRIARLWKRFEG